MNAEVRVPGMDELSPRPVSEPKNLKVSWRSFVREKEKPMENIDKKKDFFFFFFFFFLWFSVQIFCVSGSQAFLQSFSF